MIRSRAHVVTVFGFVVLNRKMYKMHNDHNTCIRFSSLCSTLAPSETLRSQFSEPLCLRTHSSSRCGWFFPGIRWRLLCPFCTFGRFISSPAARILRRVSERADGRRVSLLERVFELAHDETVDLFLASPHSVVHNIELLLDCEHLFGATAATTTATTAATS